MSECAPVGHVPQHQRSDQEPGHVDGLRGLDQAAPVTHQVELRTGRMEKGDTELFVIGRIEYGCWLKQKRG